MIRSLSAAPPFDEIRALMRASSTGDPALPGQVAAIIDRVVRGGDQGLLECVREFDGSAAQDVAMLRIGGDELEQAAEALPPELRASLERVGRG